MANVGIREWLAVGRAVAEGKLLRYADNAHFGAAFEHRLAAYVGSKYALTVNSGTSALICALASAGVGPGDEVLVPAYTWLATPAAAVIGGAVPILVDINDTLTMDPIDLERKITPFTKAIIPVHMLNLPCAMDEIIAIARKNRLLVIEDACQAVGVQYKDKFCGALGDAGAFSFNKFKNINIGEGGAVLTSDDRLFARALNFHDLGLFARGLENRQRTCLRRNEHARDRNRRCNARRPACEAEANDGAPASPLRFDRTDPGAEHQVPCRSAQRSGNAVSVCVTFTRKEEAIAFAQQRGVSRLLDNSKHVYTNWEAILTKRSFNPRMNAWKWAQRPINYDVDMCAKTLDILGRTCRIQLGERYPLLVMRHLAERLSR